MLALSGAALQRLSRRVAAYRRMAKVTVYGMSTMSEVASAATASVPAPPALPQPVAAGDGGVRGRSGGGGVGVRDSETKPDGVGGANGGGGRTNGVRGSPVDAVRAVERSQKAMPNAGDSEAEDWENRLDETRDEGGTATAATAAGKDAGVVRTGGSLRNGTFIVDTFMSESW